MSEAFHQSFANALAHNDPSGLAAFVSDSDAPGLAVYRNNVAKSLTDALGDASPAVRRLIGPRNFSALARRYRETYPLRTGSLALYGEGLVALIEQWEPVGHLPFLADIARIDRAWLEAHHAINLPTMMLKDAQTLDPAALATLAPGLHKSVRIIPSQFPAYAIWRTNREDDAVETVRLDAGPQTALVHRPRGDVLHRTLTPAEQVFLGCIADGETFEAASCAVARDIPGADPAPVFIRLLTEGVFSRDFL